MQEAADIAKAYDASKKPEDLAASRDFLNKLAEKYKLPAHPEGDWGLDADGVFR